MVHQSLRKGNDVRLACPAGERLPHGGHDQVADEDDDSEDVQCEQVSGSSRDAADSPHACARDSATAENERLKAHEPSFVCRRIRR